MKMQPGHIDALRKAITETIDTYGKERITDDYENGRFARSDKVKDINKRLCFDLLYAADVRGLMDEIYEYCNDEHIYMALKSICPRVERKY